MLTEVQHTTIPFLFSWLFIETMWDFRDRQIPLWFSWIPLLTGLVYLILLGDWLIATLLGISLMATHILTRWQIFAVVGSALGLVWFSDTHPLLIGWLILYGLWALGWLGAADSLAGLYLLIWFPEWEMLMSIGLGILIWHVGLAVDFFGRQVGLKIWTTVQTQAKGTKVPGLGAFLFAISIFELVFLQ
jgi:hypothetical protein